MSDFEQDSDGQDQDAMAAAEQNYYAVRRRMKMVEKGSDLYDKLFVEAHKIRQETWETYRWDIPRDLPEDGWTPRPCYKFLPGIEVDEDKAMEIVEEYYAVRGELYKMVMPPPSDPKYQALLSQASNIRDKAWDLGITVITEFDKLLAEKNATYESVMDLICEKYRREE